MAQTLSKRERRTWPVSEKRRIVELSLQPNFSVNAIAKQFDLDAPTISSWRTMYRNGKLQNELQEQREPLPKLLPVTITDPARGTARKTVVRINMPSGVSIVVETETPNLTELGTLLAMMQI